MLSHGIMLLKNATSCFKYLIDLLSSGEQEEMLAEELPVHSSLDRWRLDLMCTGRNIFFSNMFASIWR